MKPTESSPVQGRWASLDALRGLAALVVFLFHYVCMTGGHTNGWALWEKVESLALYAGSLGTNLLLLLCGFFIGKSLTDPDFSYANFLSKRVVRLYVPYAALLVAAMAFWAVFPAFAKNHPGQSDLEYFANQMLLVPGLFTDRPVLTVSWTLSYIFSAYCLLPLVAKEFRKWFGGTMGLAALWMGCVVGVLTTNYFWDWTLNRVAYIPAGCMLAEVLFRRQWWISRRWHMAALLFIAVVAGMARYSVLHFTAQAGLGAAEIALCASVFGLTSLSSLTLFFIASGPVLGRRFSSFHSRFLCFVGRRGYSFYLLHGVATKVMVVLVLSSVPGWLGLGLFPAVFMLFCLGASILAADLSFRVLEVQVPALLSLLGNRKNLITLPAVN